MRKCERVTKYECLECFTFVCNICSKFREHSKHHPPHPLSAGGVEPPAKFSKSGGRGLTGPELWEEGC